MEEMLGLNDLPPELLEIVFSCLPLQTLLGTCSLVCSSWNDIISQSKFLKWRKAYFKYKRNDSDDDPFEDDEAWTASTRELLGLEESESVIGKFEAPLFRLILRMQKFYEHKSKLFSRIKLMERYEACHKNLELNLPPGSSPPNDAMVTTMMIITANSVWSIRNILRNLLSSSSSATTTEITEYLYMMLLFLLQTVRKDLLEETHHFRVYQALYFIENEWSVTPTNSNNNNGNNNSSKKPGQQSLMSFGFNKTVPSKIPTAEQMKIIHHPLTSDRKDLVKIVAFAGTGKTTTLVKLTEQNPNLKFLLVVYNKSVRVQAEQQFPKTNVVCKTVHQMAMAECGFMFNKKLTNNLKAKDIMDSGLLMERGEEDGGLQRRAGQVLASLNSFLNSADTDLSLEHVPSVWSVGNHDISLSSVERQVVLEDAVSVWRSMKNKEDMSVWMPHDGYLKLWQLRAPNLQWVTKHDVLLLDEGQDMNPTMLDIFMKQSVTRVIVGDPHQQIYMFRGAVNALDLITPTHTYYLTQSFRFGPEIASVANKWLFYLKSVEDRTLVGGMKRDSYLGTNIDPRDQVAFIGRSNFGLFQKLNQLIFDDNCKSVGLVGGVESYNFDDYLDIFYLMKGQNDKMKKYKNWKSYAQFSAFAKNVADVELLSKIKIVEKFGDRMPAIIDKVKSVLVKDIRKADIVLSTIHKAKGLEFDTVVLLDGWMDGQSQEHPSDWPEDEKNLLYVAITRAKNNLVLNDLASQTILPINYQATINQNVSKSSEDLDLVGFSLSAKDWIVRNHGIDGSVEEIKINQGFGSFQIKEVVRYQTSQVKVANVNGRFTIVQKPDLEAVEDWYKSVGWTPFFCFIVVDDVLSRGVKRRRSVNDN